MEKKYKEFRIGELFDVENTWIYGKNKEYQTRFNKPTSKTLEVISGITERNGVNYYTEDIVSDNEIYCNCLTISTRGEYSGTVFYHDNKFVLANNILVMPMPNWNKNAQLYIATCISKLGYGGYANYPTKEKLKQDVIKLPLVDGSSDQIDFEYMEERISELEAERISELEAFLVATGLNDYELTEDDRQILHSALMAGAESQSLTSSDSCLKWERKYKEFRVGDILNVEQTLSVVSKSDLIEGDIPYVTRTSTNNGYMSTCGNISQLNKGNCITVGAETGIAFYQPSDFVAGNKIYRLSRNGLNEKMYLYLATVLNAHTKNYSYSNARIPSKIKEEIVILPIIPDTTNQIDFEYMERYIKAIEKTVIANVVKYKDQVIEETKKVVANNATT